MAKIEWYDKNIFTAYDMPATLLINTGYTHRIRAYESETIIYVDDTLTGTNRPAGMYILNLWSTNPHGTPPTIPTIYTVYVDVYDTNNVLKERFTLKYMYGATKYLVSIVDENDQQLEAVIHYAIRTSSDVFFVKYYGATIGIPDRTVNDLILEVIRNKDSKKYYTVAYNPTLYTNTAIKLYPKNRYIIKITYDVSMFNNIPVLKQLYDFVMWLGVRITNALLPIAQGVTNAVGIKLPIVNIEYSNGLLSVYYENDVAPAVIVAIIIAVSLLGIAVAITIRDVKLAEISYSIEQLAHDSYKQYLYTVQQAIEFAKTTPDPQKTLEILLPYIQMPQIGTASNVLQNKDDMITQLKNMLFIGIAGAIIVTVLMMVRR